MLHYLNFGRYYGLDSLVDLLIIIVSLIISYSSYRIYKLINEENYKLFSLSFFCIALSFVFKILSNLTILYQVKIEMSNFVYLMVSQWKYMQLVNFFSYICYKSFYIIGLVLLFLIITKTTKKERMLIFIYMSIITVILSIFYNPVFHITVSLLLVYITMHFYDNYKDKRTVNSMFVFLAFFIMLISHFFFIFSGIDSLFYLVGEILLLISFVNLLINQLKMRNRGQKRVSRKR